MISLNMISITLTLIITTPITIPITISIIIIIVTIPITITILHLPDALGQKSIHSSILQCLTRIMYTVF